MENKLHIYDCIVLGLGADGSSALYHLSKQSQNILGLEQYQINHKNGSSHGDTRIIRQAYFEGQHYIPLAKRAYELWDEIELLSGKQVFFKVGGLNASKENNFLESGNIVKKCKEACDNYSIRHKVFKNSNEINEEFNYFNFPKEENFQALFEYEAGYLKAEDCVRIHLQLAEKNGAKALYDCKVNRIAFNEELNCYVLSEENHEVKNDVENNWNNNSQSEMVCFNNVSYQEQVDSICSNINSSSENVKNEKKKLKRFYAKKIVLSCGSWINEILTLNFNIKLPLTVDLNHVYYFKFLNTNLNLSNNNNNDNYINSSSEKKLNNSNLQNIPIFIIQEDHENEFYGFPDINNGNFFKFSLYHQKLTHNSVSEVKRSHNAEIFSKVKKLCKKFIKNFTEENVQLVKEINCLYTSTPDCDFIIDYLPKSDKNIIVCSACSGHGFKFSSAVGEHIKKLIYEECLPYDEFKIKRFGDCFIK